MGRKAAAAVGTALAIGVAAWLLQRQWHNVRVPDGIDVEHAWKAKLCHLGLQTLNALDVAAEKVGVSREVVRVTANAIQNFLATGSPLSKGSDEQVKVRFERFDNVPVKIFESKAASGSTNRPALIYFHGGGFVWFSPDLADSFCRRIARELGFLVVSVDYRLAPENPFPAAYDDCLAVSEHVLRDHERLGVDVRRVLVGGDSAGGNLAAGVAARLKKRLKMQILIYPMLQAFDFKLPAFVDNSESFVIGPNSIIKHWLHYGNLSASYLPTFLANRHLQLDVRAQYARRVHSDLIPAHLEVTSRRTLHPPPGDAAVSAAVSGIVLDPRYAPLMAYSLDDYPDAYVVTAQYDVLRDEGIMYAQRLSEARNVRVKLEHYRDAFHGFFVPDSALSTPVASRAMEKLVTFLRIHVLQLNT